MNKTHTPGPWLFRAKSDSVYTPPTPGTPYTYGDFIFAFSDNDGPNDEDLALILAAPDLLDALRDLDSRLRDCFAIPGVADAYDSAYQDSVADAIAKATGA